MSYRLSTHSTHSLCFEWSRSVSTSTSDLYNCIFWKFIHTHFLVHFYMRILVTSLMSSIVDADAGPNAELKYGLGGKKADGESFRIDAKTGEVFAVQTLNVGEDYQITVSTAYSAPSHLHVRCNGTHRSRPYIRDCVNRRTHIDFTDSPLWSHRYRWSVRTPRTRLSANCHASSWRRLPYRRPPLNRPKCSRTTALKYSRAMPSDIWCSSWRPRIRTATNSGTTS